uniref:Cubilin n=1 Tax=Magallana gigas TaxID=29159 RepID=A0A8W8NNZ5_MAGGI
MKWITLICVINCLQYSAGSPPSAPGGVRVVYREASFIVTWDVPRRTYGTVTNYVVPVTILPEANQTVYRSQIPLLVLDAGSEIGKMFYLTVSAENKDGLSKPSRPFYIRSPCGEALTVTPGSTITLTSPGYPDPVDRGVICQWGLNTTDTYLIQYRFVLIDFKGGSQTGGQSCDDAFLSLSDDQRPTVKICENRSEQDIQRGPVDKFSFSSGIRSRIRKFKVMITAKVKPPGPPTDIKMTSSRTSISMTWSPPIGRYEPLTSYTLRYRLSNYKREIVLSPRTPWFSINTLNFKGQLLVFNIYGNISDTKGQESKEQYFRAPCGEHLRLPGSRELQISSPGHPRPYAPGISCTWVVDNPQQDNLTVTVVHMDIESSLSCSSDYLSISIGGSSRRCGKILRPISLTTVEKSVKISFLSDYKNQGNGFLIEVKTAGEERTSSPQTDLTQWTGVTSAAPLGVPTTEAPWSLSYPEIIGSSIEHAVHNVSIHLEFIRRRRYRKKSISNNINILSTLHDKLYTVFKHPSGILQDLALRIIEADPLFVSLVLIYSVPKLLIQMKTDDDFRLIKFINDTAINELSKDTLTFGEWTLNCNKLSQFRTMKAFYVQEITSPCTLVVGVCGKNTSCATDTTTIFGITCVKSNSTGTASVQSTGRTDGLTPVIVGGSASAVVLLLLIVVLIICRGCPRRSLPVTQHRPFNDILLQSRYIGDKNVQFTAFSSRDLKTNRKRKKAISVSLPTKSIKSPYMNGLLVEKLQQLDFIEDKKTLKQRLRIKYRSRRSNSL